VDGKLTTPVGGIVAAVGSALSALPFVIVSAGSSLQLSASALPVVNIPPTSITNLSCDAGDLQPCTTISGLPSLALSAGNTVIVESSSGLVRTMVATSISSSVVASGPKTVPRLSRLNAIDLSITATTDSESATVTAATAVSAVQPEPQTVINLSTTNVHHELSESGIGDVERPAVQRRGEIAPIPGAVCSAEDAARVGSSYLCSVCGKTFSSAPQLAVHRNIHYFERRSVKCPVCRTSFTSRAAMEQHASREHHDAGGSAESYVNTSAADPRPFKCDECGVAFRIQGHLAKHKRSKVHATRLEQSQEDLGGATGGDVEESAIPLIVDERGVQEVECNEDQNETDGQEMNSAAEPEPQQPDNGEIIVCWTCTLHCSVFLIRCVVVGINGNSPRNH